MSLWCHRGLVRIYYCMSLHWLVRTTVWASIDWHVLLYEPLFSLWAGTYILLYEPLMSPWAGTYYCMSLHWLVRTTVWASVFTMGWYVLLYEPLMSPWAGTESHSAKVNFWLLNNTWVAAAANLSHWPHTQSKCIVAAIQIRRKTCKHCLVTFT